MNRAAMSIVAMALGSCAVATPSPSAMPGVPAQVIGVPDGDSLLVVIDGTEEKVRLIGVNAPERDECFGEESTAGLRNLVDDTEVDIDTDIETRDQYGRLLAYVYRDGTFINEEVARQGLVLTRAFEPNTTMQEQIDQAGQDAKLNQRGMWTPTACGSTAASSITIIQIQANPPGPDEEDLNGEWIEIENTGPTDLNLNGWSIRDASSVHRFSFPSGTVLDAGRNLVVHTGCGDDRPGHQFWCSDGPVWDNTGDSALLLDNDGRIADTFDY